MILEALRHFLTPAPPAVKKMGYVREAIAIEARYKRCRSAWAPHLENCKAEILKAVASLQKGDRVMILGSGALHDVPVAEILAQELDLICVDIVHLPHMRRQYKELTFIEKDITELVEPLYKAGSLPNSYDVEWEIEAELVISLNLLSQLPLCLVDYAEKQNRALPDDFAEQVAQAHLDWLKNLKTPVLLICDRERYYYEGEQQVACEQTAQGPGKPQMSWLWDVAPKGEAGKNISIQHRVRVYRF